MWADTLVARQRTRLRGLIGIWPAIHAQTTGRANVVLVYSRSIAVLAIARAAAARSGASCLLECTEVPFGSHQGPVRRKLLRLAWTRFGWKLPDGIVAVSNPMRRAVGPWLRAGSAILHVPVMVDLGRAGTRTERDGRPRYVLYTGHVSPTKGVNDLLDAFDRVSRSQASLQLWITGNPMSRSYLRRLKAEIEERGLSERVRLLGVVPSEVIPGLLSDAEVLVVPHPAHDRSRAAFPTKLAEYLASGRPVVATDTGSLNEYLESGVSALLVPPGGVPEMAAAIGTLVADPDLAGRIGRAGRLVAEKNFDQITAVQPLADWIRLRVQPVAAEVAQRGVGQA